MTAATALRPVADDRCPLGGSAVTGLSGSPPTPGRACSDEYREAGLGYRDLAPVPRRRFG